MSQCDGTDTYCGGACSNLQGDARNCGACGKMCNTQAGEVCQKGKCGPACTSTQALCGAGCADVQSDPQNCGDCAKACGGAESCVMGKCTLLCQMGLTSCARTAVPPSDAGAPEAGTDASAPDAGPTSMNACVDLQSDPMNCGKCGTVCPPDKNGCDKGACKIYKFPGIVTNLNPDDLSSAWSECFSETYSIGGTTLASVLTTKCTRANLMLACRLAQTKTLVVAAEGARADVTFDVGNGSNASHTINGVSWYYSTGASWGFFVPLDNVSRNSCDIATGAAPDRRLCWHTGASALQSGYRCGSTITFATNYERVILQAP